MLCIGKPCSAEHLDELCSRWQVTDAARQVPVRRTVAEQPTDGRNGVVEPEVEAGAQEALLRAVDVEQRDDALAAIDGAVWRRFAPCPTEPAASDLVLPDTDADTSFVINSGR